MSPYEIRLKLLEMAKDLLVENYHQQAEIERINWEKTVQEAERNCKTFQLYERKIPFPTEIDIVNKAKILKDFVSAKE